MDDISIISVYHSWMSKRLLELNWDNTKKLNPNVSFIWFAGDNTPNGNDPSIDEKFVVVRNTGINTYHNMVSPHHASGINVCLPHVKTRFLLSMDNDIFIMRPNWISDVINHMKRNELAFFGIPWHVKDWVKYRYFPGVQGMFIDLEKIDIMTLDFSPSYILKNKYKALNERKEYELRKKTYFHRKMKDLFPQKFANYIGKSMRTLDFKRRKKNIGIGHDTGYPIYQKYGNNPQFKREVVQSIWQPYQAKWLKDQINLPLNTFIEFFLPDRLCYLPKDKSYFTTKNIDQIAVQNNWEQFSWKNDLFAVNIHGSPSKTRKRNSNPEEEVQKVQSYIDRFK